MKIHWRTEWLMWLLLAGMFAIAAWAWGDAPNRIPVHWGLSGQPDRWGGKFEGLLLLPLVGLGIYGLSTLLPRIDPGRANYPSFAGAFHTVRLLVLLILCGVEVTIVLTTRGHSVDMVTITPLGLGVLFVVLGNVLGKLRPNWFVGIRTPWTLSSKESWMRTHRLGGWVFVLVGFLFMGLALLRKSEVLPVMMGVILTTVVGLTIYSYIVWKGDANKMPPAGTVPAETSEA